MENKNTPKLVLVTGGARSGKSRFAEEYCRKLQREGNLSVTYLATCPRLDAEMDERIAAHIARRPADWGCIEETSAVADRIRSLDPACGVILLDCLSLLLNNWMWEREQLGKTDQPPEKWASSLMADLLDACRSYPHPVVMVTNEVGSGIVPDNELSRQYRDALGVMNQIAAREAAAVYAVFSGIPIELSQFRVCL
ncbi:bifunctional adenosylcobinamide kinase/adenosylcobinamide-phosphate guanylyltransferase [Effusibacillus dendaii]|uniref:Adenosylcobinamide kinase n=1 Tax=Effusibacillus dendaii TaxID=2743772 RepID=A0A7I8DBA2_9BACL|nr:bifunctional adenosylcobinamide kinase/adenosylcobinamide-phosphate guanylyltransferase [Effusibacillus dendaii]BCJ86632.1 adenosylcobinamide kinase/adenosylcobinamide phosphate guanyltransferase [Effusibacillus dendaii]